MLRVLLPALLLLVPGTQAPAPVPGTIPFRHWMDGQELGGGTRSLQTFPDGRQVSVQQEWMELTRMGLKVRQSQELTATRHPGGRLAFTWSLQLATQPLTGTASWEPGRPGLLHVAAAGAEARDLPVPDGALLWPEDLETALKRAAQDRKPFRAVTFAFPLQQWSTLELTPLGPEALPGVADAIRFRGTETEGRQVVPTEVWVSPTQGEVRHRSVMGGMELLLQRADLPAPGPTGLQENLFARSLKPLPRHAFLPWLPELEVEQRGGVPVTLAPTSEAEALGPGHWKLRRAALPTGPEATEPPVTGTPTAEEAPYLAPSPLVPFRDPIFEGLLRRLAPRPGAPRWELAQAVNSFVYDWITDKDYGVGFASAREVAVVPRGDCTEHGVLAVALLRRLGVPARGAVGWVALEGVLGPHFWVEVKLQHRWVPLDPTFDQAPASAFRLKLGDTDLADLGSVGWEAAQILGEATWTPRWTDPRVEGDRLRAPDGLQLRYPGGHWSWIEGRLLLRTPSGRLELSAVPPPLDAQRREGRRLQGRSGLTAWWTPGDELLVNLGPGRWMRVMGLTEPAAYTFLDTLRVEPATSR
jgi:hypothetical protein